MSDSIIRYFSDAIITPTTCLLDCPFGGVEDGGQVLIDFPQNRVMWYANPLRTLAASFDEIEDVQGIFPTLSAARAWFDEAIVDAVLWGGDDEAQIKLIGESRAGRVFRLLGWTLPTFDLPHNLRPARPAACEFMLTWQQISYIANHPFNRHEEKKS